MLALRLHLLRETVERVHCMFHDILISHNCSVSFINAVVYIQLAETTFSFHSHFGPVGHIPSFKVKLPTSNFEIILCFHSLCLLAVTEKTLKVLVSYKNGMGLPLPCNLFFNAWKADMEAAGLGSWSISGEPYIFYD